MLSDERTHNTEQPSPETRNAARSATDWRWESFRCPSVQDSVEHGLKKVLHNVEADVRCGAVDRAEEEDADAHQGGGNDHSPFSTDA